MKCLLNIDIQRAVSLGEEKWWLWCWRRYLLHAHPMFHLYILGRAALINSVPWSMTPHTKVFFLVPWENIVDTVVPFDATAEAPLVPVGEDTD